MLVQKTNPRNNLDLQKAHNKLPKDEGSTRYNQLEILVTTTTSTNPTLTRLMTNSHQLNGDIEAYRISSETSIQVWSNRIYTITLNTKKVYTSNIRIFYGRYGSSAKVNISSDDIDIVETDAFWPDGTTCRK